MTRFHESELSRRIDDTILAHLEAGEPTADEVSKDVLTQNDDLIREYGHELAKAQVRSIVSDRMKKTLATKKAKSPQSDWPSGLARSNRRARSLSAMTPARFVTSPRLGRQRGTTRVTSRYCMSRFKPIPHG